MINSGVFRTVAWDKVVQWGGTSAENQERIVDVLADRPVGIVYVAMHCCSICPLRRRIATSIIASIAMKKCAARWVTKVYEA